MPNRVLRDWTTSDNVDRLSAEAEVFFTRLIMKADDYGNYPANPKLLRSALYPLREVSTSLVNSCLKECLAVKIIRKYTVDEKDYLTIPNFDQRLRSKRSKYPLPTDDSHMTDTCPPSADNGRPETKRNETETESETRNETEGASAQVSVWPGFDDFWDLYDKKTGRPKCESLWKKIEQEAREKIMIHLDDYVKSTPDKKYRKNPTTYLNGKCWNDEIVTSNGKAKNGRPDHFERAKQIDALIDLRNNH